MCAKEERERGTRVCVLKRRGREEHVCVCAKEERERGTCVCVC